MNKYTAKLDSGPNAGSKASENLMKRQVAMAQPLPGAETQSLFLNPNLNMDKVKALQAGSPNVPAAPMEDVVDEPISADEAMQNLLTEAINNNPSNQLKQVFELVGGGLSIGEARKLL
jgi:hypothetical protein